MNNKVDQILRWVLTPLSWIYGAVMWVRNKLFDIGILSQVEFDVPVVGVGNITVGGTGKTPHTEYIISNLSGQYKVAVLSRGYKRHTKGFIMANSKSSPETIGDEPWQIYNKFGKRVKVAVCESRKKGISELLKLYPDLELIVLDDSFQHRWVKPKITILLMEYGRPVYTDHLLPLGRLRESPHEINRADMVIVTKCPDNVAPIDLRLKTKELDLMKFQKIFFSRYNYENVSPVFPEDANFRVNLDSLKKNDSVLLLTGIAHPRYFVRHFSSYPFRVKVEHFPDHHDFSRKDISSIESRFRLMKGERKIIITTEKDAVRLAHNPYFPQELKPFVFFQPISVEMIPGPQGHNHNLITELKKELKLPKSDFEEDSYKSVVTTTFSSYDQKDEPSATSRYSTDKDEDYEDFDSGKSDSYTSHAKDESEDKESSYDDFDSYEDEVGGSYRKRAHAPNEDDDIY